MYINGVLTQVHHDKNRGHNEWKRRGISVRLIRVRLIADADRGIIHIPQSKLRHIVCPVAPQDRATLSTRRNLHSAAIPCDRTSTLKGEVIVCDQAARGWLQPMWRAIVVERVSKPDVAFPIACNGSGFAV
jgi:hypothetical protein